MDLLFSSLAPTPAVKADQPCVSLHFHAQISIMTLLLPPRWPLPTLERPSPTSLLRRLLADRHNIDRDSIETHALEQILRIVIHIQLSRLGVLREVEGRDLRHVLILALTFLFLELEGDAADGAALDALHQVGGVACDLGGGLVRIWEGRRERMADLVAKTLGSDDGDLIAYPLVGLEVEGELWVVAFDDDFSGLLHCLWEEEVSANVPYDS
jgi:hypothetical protein